MAGLDKIALSGFDIKAFAAFGLEGERSGTVKGSEQQDYFSYLLRLWRASGVEPTVWRMSLEDPHTGERIGFASLESLFAFLEAQIGHDADREERSTSSDS